MARIRTIKPEFPQSETIGKLSRDARLLFIQLWTIVDDEGRARAPSRMLASLLYPYDDDAIQLIDGWLEELEAKGCIRRYEVDGSSYLDIPNWLKHQKIDRPSKSKVPEFVESSRAFDEVHRVSDADLGPRTMDLGREETARAVSAREPSNDDPKVRLKRRITEAYRRLSNDPNRPSIDTGQIDVWAAQGFNLGIVEAVIMDKLEAQLRAGKQVRSLRYFEDSIREAHETRAPAKVIEAAEPDWRALVRRWKEKGSWPSPLGPAPGYGGCKAPHEVLAEFGYGDAA